jgi:CheY-like chemotaxis protein
MSGSESTALIRRQVREGSSFTARLSALPSLWQTHVRSRPVIMAMTANVLSEDRAACLACGMQPAFISKPISAGLLESAINTWAAKLKQIDEVGGELEPK